MGAFSLWHWVIVVLFVAIPMIVIVAVARYAAHSSRRSNASARPVASRLAELDGLRASGSISDTEAEAERIRILRDL